AVGSAHIDLDPRLQILEIHEPVVTHRADLPGFALLRLTSHRHHRAVAVHQLDKSAARALHVEVQQRAAATPYDETPLGLGDHDLGRQIDGIDAEPGGVVRGDPGNQQPAAAIRVSD